MGSIARRFASATSLLGLIACATLADIHPGESKGPPATDGSNTGETSSSGDTTGASSGGTGGASSGGTGGGSRDAASEGSANDPACTKKKEDERCDANEECCSGACNEDHECRDRCKPATGFDALGCDPGGDDCCVGHFCEVGLPPSCKPCIQTGANSAGGNPRTCCSGRVEGGLSLPKKCVD